MSLSHIDQAENRRLMREGELYYAFTPDLTAHRKRCALACQKYNMAGDVSRRRLVELFRNILNDETALPPTAPTAEEDDVLLEDEPWVESPVRMDYGYNVKMGKNVYVNSNSNWVDTGEISVGSRTLIGPGCSFYAGGHPLQPGVRNGTQGPEFGKPIIIEEDCWLGGNVIVLPGIRIGRGSTVGAGSVVTKDVPPMTVVAGNPARVIREVVEDKPRP